MSIHLLVSLSCKLCNLCYVTRTLFPFCILHPAWLAWASTHFNPNYNKESFHNVYFCTCLYSVLYYRQYRVQTSIEVDITLYCKLCVLLQNTWKFVWQPGSVLTRFETYSTFLTPNYIRALDPVMKVLLKWVNCKIVTAAFFSLCYLQLQISPKPTRKSTNLSTEYTRNPLAIWASLENFTAFESLNKCILERKVNRPFFFCRYSWPSWSRRLTYGILS